MFTDIVGSTRMTQTQGDAGAQELVRKHNEIVRGALQAHEGLEIKHTGDGIMASFKNTAKAIDGAVEMQRGFAAHNAENPDHELNIRIGVNAGQPSMRTAICLAPRFSSPRASATRRTPDRFSPRTWCAKSAPVARFGSNRRASSP